MKDRLGFVSASGAVIAAGALAVVVVVTLVMGPVLFSPGGLSAQAKGKSLGGVASHAQLGENCDACHTPPWSSRTMTDRCVACHAEVGTQISSRTGLHGLLVAGLTVPMCRACHTDHRGPNGSLTDFDHSKLPFKLVGKHANVACDQCHAGAASLLDFQNTPRACYSCHAKDDNHKGSFGQQCGQCHTPASWADATFDHTIFPINHGKEGGGSSPCTTCHPNGVSTYTCYGCHEHTIANVQAEHRGQTIANLADCVKCHAGGRGGD